MCSSSWPQHQQKLQEGSVMASNRNQLASYTVDVLELITRELQAPFVIPSMVDRISSMLNYVLKQLVGPKRRQLNVSLLAGHCFSSLYNSQLIVVSLYKGSQPT